MIGVEEQHRKLWKRQCRESLLARFELYATDLEPIERFGNEHISLGIKTNVKFI